MLHKCFLSRITLLSFVLLFGQAFVSFSSHAMEPEDQESNPWDVMQEKEYLSKEDRQRFENQSLTKEVKLQYPFNPKSIEAILVGCNPEEHEEHFFGSRHYNNENGFSGNIIWGRAYPFYEGPEGYQEWLPYITAVKNDINSHLYCYYTFPKTKFNTQDKTQARKHAFSKESGPFSKESGPFCGSRKGFEDDNNPWEIDPQTTLYINWEIDPQTTRYINWCFGSSFNHIIGDFREECIPELLPPLPNLRKILIEYYKQRTLEDFERIIKNSYHLLPPGGVIYLEVSKTLKTLTKQEFLDKLTSNNPSFDWIEGEDQIPGRGERSHNPVDVIRGTKK
jgi:hypothetical protein